MRAGKRTLKYRFFAAGSRGRAPGGVSGVSPEILSPPAPEGSALKTPIVERGKGMGRDNRIKKFMRVLSKVRRLSLWCFFNPRPVHPR